MTNAIHSLSPVDWTWVIQTMKITDVINLVMPKCSLAITYRHLAKVHIASALLESKRFLEGIIENRYPSSRKNINKIPNSQKSYYKIIQTSGFFLRSISCFMHVSIVWFVKNSNCVQRFCSTCYIKEVVHKLKSQLLLNVKHRGNDWRII